MVSADADARSARAAGECERALRESIDAGTLERHRNWIAQEQRHAATCRRSHEECLGAVQAAAVILQKAARHVRMMERLRERARRRHQDASRRAESKVLDELATVQFARRKSEGGSDRDH
jgi:flagellar export protein FliJ